MPEIVLRAVLNEVQKNGLPDHDRQLALAFARRNEGALLDVAGEAARRSAWRGAMATPPGEAPADARPDTAELLPLDQYDRVLVGFSGGKDSVACVLHLVERMAAAGLNPGERIELWHHRVDGDSNDAAMLDWPCTDSYCEAFARAHGLPLVRSWREGGFLREMRRHDTPTAAVAFETPSGVRRSGGKGPPGTRGLFPQVTSDLSIRWCSAYLKIMVADAAIANDPRFARDVKLLVVTGERRQESANRARYPRTETHRVHAPSKRRLVHHHRPVLDWREEEVWEILRRWGVVPHPCYWLGFGRASCQWCIFSQAAEWATLQALDPDGFERIARMEAATGKTIARSRSVREQAERGASFLPDGPLIRFWQRQALGRFDAPIRVDPSHWLLPAGAFRKGAGPS